MNGSALTVLFAFALFGVNAQVDHQKAREGAKKLIQECKSKVGASDADVEAVRTHKAPTTKEGLCLIECVFDSAGIMKDGKFSKDGMIEGFKPVMGEDQTHLDNLKNLAETCEKELGSGNADKCEAAKDVAVCIIGHAPNHGFEIPPPHQS